MEEKVAEEVKEDILEEEEVLEEKVLEEEEEVDNVGKKKLKCFFHRGEILITPVVIELELLMIDLYFTGFEKKTFKKYL